MLNQSEERRQYLNFTDPFITASVVLVARNDVPFIDGMRGTVGKSLGIVKDYVYEVPLGVIILVWKLFM